MFLIIRQLFLTMGFIAFDFIILCDVSSNPNNLVEILFIRAFLFHCLICLNILLTALKISKTSFSRSNLINLHQDLVRLVFVFLFRCQNFCCCVHFYQFLLKAYSHENITKSSNLQHYVVFLYFSFKWTHCFCWHWLFFC